MRLGRMVFSARQRDDLFRQVETANVACVDVRVAAQAEARLDGFHEVEHGRPTRHYQATPRLTELFVDAFLKHGINTFALDVIFHWFIRSGRHRFRPFAANLDRGDRGAGGGTVRMEKRSAKDPV